MYVFQMYYLQDGDREDAGPVGPLTGLDEEEAAGDT
jgi:hypothetical protein